MSTSGKTSTGHSWPARVVGFLAFCFHFSRELVMANIAIAKSVLFQKRADLAPGFLTYPLKGLSHFEILLLTHTITLTPGTTSVKVSDDFSELLIHAFDARDPDGVRASIKNGLETPILAWTR
jgi:multicomponent Na+:H+ antiporter subunit E